MHVVSLPCLRDILGGSVGEDCLEDEPLCHATHATDGEMSPNCYNEKQRKRVKGYKGIMMFN